jgi:hypothetical protein
MNFWKKQSSFCSVRYQKDIKNHNNMYEMSWQVRRLTV